LYYGSALFEGNFKLSLVQELFFFLDDMADQSIYCIYRSRRFVHSMFLGLSSHFNEDGQYLKSQTGLVNYFLDGHDEGCFSSHSSVMWAQLLMYYKYPGYKFSVCVPMVSPLEASETYFNAYGWLDSTYTCVYGSNLIRKLSDVLG